MQAVDIRQIADKFPDKRGGLKEMYDKGPQSAFFLVKFWVTVLFVVLIANVLYCAGSCGVPPSFPGEPELESLEISGTGFLCSICPSCQPSNSVRELKRTQNTDLTQWPRLILFIHHHTPDDRCCTTLYTIIIRPVSASSQVFSSV